MEQFTLNIRHKETRVFNTVAVSVSMYEDEARVTTEGDKAEMKSIRNTPGCTILDRNKNVDIRMVLGIKPIVGIAKERCV